MGTDWGYVARHVVYAQRPDGGYNLLLFDTDCDLQRCSGAVDGVGVSCCARRWFRCSYGYVYGDADAGEHGYCHTYIYPHAEARRCVRRRSHTYSNCDFDGHGNRHGHADAEPACGGESGAGDPLQFDRRRKLDTQRQLAERQACFRLARRNNG